MHVHVDRVSRLHGSTPVLADVTLTLSAGDRIGVVGPNGVGKSTLLRLIAGLEVPDAGHVTRGSGAGIGYLPQEPERREGETVGAFLARRTGVADATAELEAAAVALGGPSPDADRYDRALAATLALGAADLDARARTVLADLGLAVELDAGAAVLSGGETARLSLAAILLSRFDVLLLDEPTNDLDLDGLDRLERFVLGHRGAVAVVSHDRAFLDRTVTAIAELEPWHHSLRLWPGGWSDFAEQRDAALGLAHRRYEEREERRSDIALRLNDRRIQARAGGHMADQRGTSALSGKVRQAERQLERNPSLDKPYEPWELRLQLGAAVRPGDVVLRLACAVARRGGFVLGPVDLDLAPGERLAVTGANGTGKSTLLGMLLGEVPLEAGTREIGRRTEVGVIGQRRDAYDGPAPLLDVFCPAARLEPDAARTLLAKFGLGAAHVHRACATLSPGERTRALLAELQAREANVLLLDEPTNHLDLAAVEELESALGRFEGSLVVVSHDRRFLECVSPTRVLELPL